VDVCQTYNQSNMGQVLRHSVDFLKLPILQWWGKWKSDRDQITSKVSKFFWLVDPITTMKSADYFYRQTAQVYCISSTLAEETIH